MSDFNKEKTIVLEGGNVQYGIEEAAERIDDLIAALQEAKNDGAEFVVMPSGNYRGAQWMSVSADWNWASEEE